MGREREIRVIGRAEWLAKGISISLLQCSRWLFSFTEKLQLSLVLLQLSSKEVEREEGRAGSQRKSGVRGERHPNLGHLKTSIAATSCPLSPQL